MLNIHQPQKRIKSRHQKDRLLSINQSINSWGKQQRKRVLGMPKVKEKRHQTFVPASLLLSD
jgi:hypothetical protein